MKDGKWQIEFGMSFEAYFLTAGAIGPSKFEWCNSVALYGRLVMRPFL
jgi:hypothetical protein